MKEEMWLKFYECGHKVARLKENVPNYSELDLRPELFCDWQIPEPKKGDVIQPCKCGVGIAIHGMTIEVEELAA